MHNWEPDAITRHLSRPNGVYKWYFPFLIPFCCCKESIINLVEQTLYCPGHLADGSYDIILQPLTGLKLLRLEI